MALYGKSFLHYGPLSVGDFLEPLLCSNCQEIPRPKSGTLIELNLPGLLVLQNKLHIFICSSCLASLLVQELEQSSTWRGRKLISREVLSGSATEPATRVGPPCR